MPRSRTSEDLNLLSLPPSLRGRLRLPVASSKFLPACLLPPLNDYETRHFGGRLENDISREIREPTFFEDRASEGIFFSLSLSLPLQIRVCMEMKL